MLVLLLHLLIGYVVSMKVIDHQNHGALHMENVIRPESTWLIVITRNGTQEGEVEAFLSTVKAKLAEDSCMLHLSKHSERKIILRIHCPLLELPDVDDEQRDNKVQSPTLEYTETYLADLFGRGALLIGRNGIQSTPQQWYGSYENIEALVRGDADSLSTGYRVLDATAEEKLYQSQSVQHNVAWNLDRVDMRFGLPTGDYLYLNDGSDVDIYVMDTGIMTSHVEFEGRASFLHNTMRDHITTDCNGHGTHVAGIIGSKTYGVAKKARLFGVRVLDCKGDGTVDDILEGADVIIARVKEYRGRPSVINLSLGGDRSAIIDAMIRELKAAGLVVVLAAGNAGKDACSFSPSNMGMNNEILAVGASDQRDYRSSYSNYGDCVSLFAPGTAITSTWHSSNTAINTISGTSMASPMAAGVAALILHQDPSLSVDRVNALLIAWATPNIVSHSISRSSNLLYSLINVTQDSVPPIPVAIVKTESPPALRPQPAVDHGVSGAEQNSASTNAILCMSVTLLGLLCLS